MKKAVIIHGTKGSPEGNWFQYVSRQLEARGYSTVVPRFPTPEGQNLESWLEHFDVTVGEVDDDTILIGHSIGAVFSLRVLERRDISIAATVLVAGLTGGLGIPEYDALNSTFIEDPFDWERIRSKARRFICLSGDNDPYVPSSQGAHIAKSLGVENLIISGGGHLNAESGFTEFQRLIEELTKIGI